jgi:hypothetical protein
MTAQKPIKETTVSSRTVVIWSYNLISISDIVVISGCCHNHLKLSSRLPIELSPGILMVSVFGNVIGVWSSGLICKQLELSYMFRHLGCHLWRSSRNVVLLDFIRYVIWGFFHLGLPSSCVVNWVVMGGMSSGIFLPSCHAAILRCLLIML